MDANSDSVLVAVAGTDALVRVIGRGSFKSSPGLKQFGVTAMERGCHRIVVDMHACVGMDSTFMGVLAGLALLLRKREGDEMILCGLSPKNRSLLETLGLTQLIRACAPGECEELIRQIEAPNLQKLEASLTDKRATTETMIAAHEQLIDVSPANLPKFKDVLTYLKDDLKRTVNPVDEVKTRGNT